MNSYRDATFSGSFGGSRQMKPFTPLTRQFPNNHEASGIVLLFFAKLPLYRQGKLWTFGSSGLPEKNRRLYRIAYWFIGAGVFFLVVMLVGLKGRQAS